MVMMAEPLWQCLQSIRTDRSDPADTPAPVVLFSPIGPRLDHAMATDRSTSAGAVLVCGRYEGIYQRFIDASVNRQISLGTSCFRVAKSRPWRCSMRWRA